MRLIWGLGFVLVVGLGFWLGNRSGNEVKGAGGGFLEAQAPVPQAAPATASPEAPKAVAPAAPPPSAPVAPRDPAAKQAAMPRAGEAELAAALLHRPWKEVSVLLEQSSLPAARKQLFGAVSVAIAGDLERAKSLAKGLDRSDELDARERDLLAAALSGTTTGPVAASAGADSVAAVAIALTLRAKEASQLLAAGRSAEAARAYSEVLVADATADWPSDRTALLRWTEGVRLAQAGHRWNVKGTWPSVEIKVKAGDSLTVIRKRAIEQNPQLLVCTGLIERANQLRSATSIHPGDVLRIPSEKPHMLVDISTRWVMYMMGDEVLDAWEGGVGKPGNDTVPGRYTIGLKQENPSWFRPGAAPVRFGDPLNPLGTRWLSWRQNGVESHLGFHGTTDPSSVGGAVSSGCIRLRNEEVEALFRILPEQAEVLVQP